MVAAGGMRGAILTLGCAGVIALSSGCSNEKIFRWQEEVVLSSGEQLLLDRTTRYRRSGEPGNPLRSGWAREDSSIVVKEGPVDLLGARYALKDWIDPVVLDRDPITRDLVMVGTAWNCDWVKRFGGKSRGIYVAFHLRPKAEAEATDFPQWAWNRRRNLYKVFNEIDPPALVTPADAERHNKHGARGHRIFFLIDPKYNASDC